MTLLQVRGQALTRLSISIRSSKLCYQHISTYDAILTTKPQAIMPGYSSDVMIVTLSRQIAKVGLHPSQRSTICQVKSGLLMHAYYLCLIFYD